MRAFPPAFALLVASALSLHGKVPSPAGPAAPTMKTLDQVEARTPVNAATTPGSAQTEFIINQPGSYYLTGNVVTSKTNGIQITAAGVTLDLNGFEIRRTTVGGESGIVINASRCTVKNGSVTRFFYGILGLSETGGGSAKGGMLLNISASQNTHGLLVGESWRIDGCVATGNTGRGIRAGFSALVRNCVVTDSGSSGAGIDVGEGSKVINCNVSGNAGRESMLPMKSRWNRAPRSRMEEMVSGWVISASSARRPRTGTAGSRASSAPASMQGSGL
jgi:hypothetical protein